VAGTNIQYIMGTVLIIIPFAVLYIYSNPYQVKRILGFLFPELFKSNVAYQLYQSLIAIGSGGLWGQGLGDSKQKLFFLPEAHTDFILAIIAEELGFIGLVVLFLLFLFLIYRGFIISLSARDKFRFFLGVGIVSCLSLQIIINIGVVMGMLPTKGLTLPYISYGGSSLLITMAMSGIMLNISEDLFLKLPITPDDTRVVRNRRKMADCKW